MGMFDNVFVLAPDLQKKLCCASGHPCGPDTDWQTKDLDCLMDSIYVTEDGLHKVESSLFDDGQERPAPPGKFLDYSGRLRIYTSCSSCEATYWRHAADEKQLPWWGPQSSYPWVEYKLLVDEGKVIAIRDAHVETPEQAQAEMVSAGWIRCSKTGEPL